MSGLEKKLEQLAAFPESAPAWRPGSPLRIATFERHRILYRKAEDGITVVRMLHQARDFVQIIHRYRP